MAGEGNLARAIALGARGILNTGRALASDERPEGLGGIAEAVIAPGQILQRDAQNQATQRDLEAYQESGAQDIENQLYQAIFSANAEKTNLSESTKLFTELPQAVASSMMAPQSKINRLNQLRSTYVSLIQLQCQRGNCPSTAAKMKADNALADVRGVEFQIQQNELAAQPGLLQDQANQRAANLANTRQGTRTSQASEAQTRQTTAQGKEKHELDMNFAPTEKRLGIEKQRADVRSAQTHAAQVGEDLTNSQAANLEARDLAQVDQKLKEAELTKAQQDNVRQALADTRLSGEDLDNLTSALIFWEKGRFGIADSRIAATSTGGLAGLSQQRKQQVIQGEQIDDPDLKSAIFNGILLTTGLADKLEGMGTPLWAVNGALEGLDALYAGNVQRPQANRSPSTTQGGGNLLDIDPENLRGQVADGTITQEEARALLTIADKLLQTGRR